MISEILFSLTSWTLKVVWTTDHHPTTNLLKAPRHSRRLRLGLYASLRLKNLPLNTLPTPLNPIPWEGKVFKTKNKIDTQILIQQD